MEFWDKSIVNTQPPNLIRAPTPEEVRKICYEGVRSMSITMPYALKQMQAMYQRTPGQTRARFVLCTTAEAAPSIIRTKRFWLRNTNGMSDYSKCSTASIFCPPRAPRRIGMRVASRQRQGKENCD